MPVPLDITGKVALVTGGSRGIGAATVKMFVEAGAKVFFNYHRAQSDAENLVRECGRDACAFMQVQLDHVESGGEMVEQCIRRFGRLDILVVNHGIWPAQDVPIDRMSEDQWQNTMGINLDSVFGLIRSGVARMKQQKAGGHVVVISSTAGQRGEAFHCDYAASKGAVISMVKGLSTELAPEGIHVNCVAPGWVDTDMAAPAIDDPVMREKIFRTIPLGRVGTPEEIAAAILFLCTPHAGFITGEVLNVNGGAVLAG